jgi:RHS repeat-associated protein
LGFDEFGVPLWEADYAAGTGAAQFNAMQIPSTSDALLLSLKTYAHDDFGRPTITQSVKFFDDNSSGGDRRRQDEGVSRFEAIYRDVNRSVEYIDALGARTVNEFDVMGRLIKTTLPGSRAVTYVWNDALRTLTETRPHASGSGSMVSEKVLSLSGDVAEMRIAGRMVYSAKFDALGRRVSARSDGEARKAWYYTAFDEVEREMRVDAAGREETFMAYNYNANGTLRQLTDGLGRQTRFHHDAPGRLVRTDFPDGHADITSYKNGFVDADGMLDRNGTRTHFDYDAFGSVRKIETDNIGSSSAWDGPSVVEYERNLLGVVSALSTNSPETSTDDVRVDFALDSSGDVRRETSSLFPKEPVGYARNLRGEAESLTVGSAATIGRAFNALGQLERLQLNGTDVARYNYAGLGSFNRTIYGPSLFREDKGFDVEGRLTSLQASTGTHSLDLFYRSDGILGRVDERYGVRPLSSSLFETDDFARVTGESHELTGLPSMQSGNITQSAISSLMQMQQPSPASSQYAFDAVNNLRHVARGDGTQAFAPHYGADHRLDDYAGTVTSDNAGAITNIAALGTSFRFDGFGRLIAATSPTDSHSLSYDALGRLVSHRSAGNGVQLFQYAGSAVVRIARSNGADSIVIPGADGLPVAFESNGNGKRSYLYYGFAERLAAVSDDNGQLVESYSYDAFGMPTARDAVGRVVAPGTATEQTALLLSGQLYLPDLQLHLQGARWYAPQLGRFISADPLGYFDGPNRFAYVGGRVLSAIDPLGLSARSASWSMSEIEAALSIHAPNRSASFRWGQVAGIASSILPAGSLIAAVETQLISPKEMSPDFLQGFSEASFVSGGLIATAGTFGLATSLKSMEGGASITATGRGAAVGLPAMALSGVGVIASAGAIAQGGAVALTGLYMQASGGVPSRPRQMQLEVDRNQAPNGIKRVDRPHVPGQEPHVHYTDGTSSNQSGSIHDLHRGVPAPARAVVEWLEEHGWIPPTSGGKQP